MQPLPLSISRTFSPCQAEALSSFSSDSPPPPPSLVPAPSLWPGLPRAPVGLPAPVGPRARSFPEARFAAALPRPTHAGAREKPTAVLTGPRPVPGTEDVLCARCSSVTGHWWPSIWTAGATARPLEETGERAFLQRGTWPGAQDEGPVSRGRGRRCHREVWCCRNTRCLGACFRAALARRGLRFFLVEGSPVQCPHQHVCV